MQVRQGAAVLIAALIVSLGGCDDKKAASTATTDAATEARQAEALKSGVEAVVYGLPLVIMDLTKNKLTNVAAPETSAAPVNQFANMRQFPDASFKDVVRANVDTLYSSAFLDVSAEPMVLTVPDTHGRYYLMPMLDAWTNVFASPGKRTTGTKAGHFAVTGPGWTGTLPKGVTQLKAPTNMVWIIGRTQTNGPKDYPAVHKIQDGYRLTPLSAFGKPYTPAAGKVDSALDMKTAPVDQLRKMSAETFFNRLATLLKSNPPPAAEAPVLEKLKAIGVTPGEKFDPAKLDPAVAKGLEQSVSVAFEKLLAASKEVGAPTNGWRIPPMVLGNYGTDYGVRAVVALVGLGANLPQDAVYPSAYVDGDGKTLTGASKYVIHFDKGALPPVNAFWSITMYDPASFFVANPINRYAISSWMPLKKNPDGSLDILVQRESPGKAQESNWLPAGDKDFNMTLRMYWPQDKAPSIIDGSWKPPAVKQVP
ncbi:DUF1254 domain-containing protein [Methylocystis echinoides]|uniref:DUF1254 domain-containing protein n=1 Tax=Methylocystis echinoides TaxID=29468 RepID=A0A9W6LTI7_9HYPH|nr:DUF1254 domain-containing protein [Methylocystis echinoides]GLI94775.1 hypothetical protein LMG27198_37670 [Methylocystis echinoides]